MRFDAGTVRDYSADDLDAVVDLFGRAVREIASRDYSPAQIDAWAPQTVDRAAWSKRLSDGNAFICERTEQIAGFASVEDSAHVDLFFVHPAFERQGVARALMARVLAWARGRGVTRLTADVSLTARAFFEHAGFVVVQPRVVELRGVSFDNFRMVRMLDLEPRAAIEQTRTKRKKA